MASPTTLADVVTIAVGCVSLAAALFIAVLAVHVSSDFRKMHDELKAVGQRVDETLKTESRFAFQADLMLNLTNSLYQAQSLLLAYFEHPPADRKKETIEEILISELKNRNKEIRREISYYKVLNDLTSESVSRLVDKHPDIRTIEFLHRLSNIVARTDDLDIGREAEMLSRRLIGHDASKWTG